MSINTAKKVICFGEILIRLQAKQNHFFGNDCSIKNYFGGSEMNVAATLAHLGIPTKLVSALPNHAISQEILSVLDSKHIDISQVLFQGERMGTYYLLSQNGLSTGEVIYDRKFSAFEQLQVTDLDWDEIFKECDWFHFSAITPALNEHLVAILKVALQKATALGLTISVDLNYRNRLWQYGLSPCKVMPELVQYAHVIMGNVWASHIMLGTYLNKSVNADTDKKDLITYAEEIAKSIFNAYPQCQWIANTFRFIKHPRHNLFFGTLHTPTDYYTSETFESDDVVDRIGSGDAFMGGLIYAIRKKYIPQEIIDTATQKGFEKLFIEGDFIQ